MNRTKLTMTVAIVATLATSVALAGQIYRYVDEDGNVHYVDRPTGAASEERLAISSRPTDDAAAMANMQARYQHETPEDGQQNGTVSDEPIEEEQELTRAERVAAARERQQKCQDYRSRMETFVTARRLYREGDDGERVYLEDNEIQDARDKVQERIEEYCD